VSIFDWMKFQLMTPLQEQVVNLDVCTTCHTKTLRVAHVDTSGSWLQCTKCKTVFHRAVTGLK
jgi:ribosomal protein L37AE/L43A